MPSNHILTLLYRPFIPSHQPLTPYCRPLMPLHRPLIHNRYPINAPHHILTLPVAFMRLCGALTLFSLQLKTFPSLFNTSP